MQVLAERSLFNKRLSSVLYSLPYCSLSKTNSIRYFASSPIAAVSSQPVSIVPVSDEAIFQLREDIRNVAIVAHVDHGKTTLVDQLLKQSGDLKHNSEIDRVLDSHAIEKERGITILSKCTSILYNNIRLNIVDTPGHQDFGGEVERIMNMIDGLLLLIDVNEGPMPQTRYILEKALKKNLTPILVFNKIDRLLSDFGRVDDCQMEIMELLDNVGYSNVQIDEVLEHIVYCSAKLGWSSLDYTQFSEESDIKPDMSILMNTIIDKISPPLISHNSSFKMLASLIDEDEFWGRYLIGKVQSGTVSVGDEIHSIQNINGDNTKVVERFKVDRMFTKRGMKRVEINTVSAGDIIGIPCEQSTVFNTLCSTNVFEPLPFDNIDKPTLCIRILANDSPFRGNDGHKLLISDIGQRLEYEAKINVCIALEKNSDTMYTLYGRGELQIAVLLEEMRREGLEFAIAAPSVLLFSFIHMLFYITVEMQVVQEYDENGELLEPFELITVDVAPDFTAVVMEYLDTHGGRMLTFDVLADDCTRITYLCPTRGLLGYEVQFRSETRGTGKIGRKFERFQSIAADVQQERIFKLIAVQDGKATKHALTSLENRSREIYVRPGDPIYAGMIVGQSNRDNDVECNPCKEKHVTNVRSMHKEEMIVLRCHRELKLEEILTLIQKDELLEITPKSIRLRKVILDEKERRTNKRKGKSL